MHQTVNLAEYNSHVGSIPATGAKIFNNFYLTHLSFIKLFLLKHGYTSHAIVLWRYRMEFLYQLTLTSKHASLISQALDFSSRCEAGQLEALRGLNLKANYTEVTDQIIKLKELLFPQLEPHASSFAKPNLQESFNLRKVIDHARSWNENSPDKATGLLTVDYDGPIEDWWHDKPAVMLVYKDKEAVRIRDQVNKTYSLTDRFEEVLGTKDIEEGLALINKWKAAYDKDSKNENLS